MASVPEKTLFDNDLADHLSDTVRILIDRPMLIPLEGHDTNQRYRIDRREMVIGRDMLCDITLNDTRSSRRHAKLTYLNFDDPGMPPEVRVTDLDSTNGIFINGVRTSEHLLTDRDKILIGSSLFGYFLRDDTELAADERLFNLANKDALTGLRNRGYFSNELRKEFDRARRYGRALSLVMFDIDHFKKCNDTYGHQAGDSVLQDMGRLLMVNIRGNDIGARYGGEEFVGILPETALDGALIQAERMRISVLEHQFSYEGKTIPISISLGVASMENCLRSADEMIAAADKALYLSKTQGRNRVSWSQNGQLFGMQPCTSSTMGA